MTKRVASLALVAAFAAVAVLGWTQAQSIQDWFKLRNYTPPANVASLAAQDTMTAKAQHLFYINHPQLVTGVSAFRQDCSETEQTIVLGCYHPIESGIAVYNVKDSRLNGIQQVTAAHEMLHAAYDRLPNSEKQQVDSWLVSYFKNGLHDQRLIDTINAYEKTEPNDVVNEMHSVFGTEAANLPNNLENYYRQYFSDRAKVAAYAASYEKEFTTRIDEISSDEATLGSLKTKISTEEQTLNNELNKINSDRTQLDNLRSSGQIDQYNSMVPGFNSEVDNYNSGLSQLKSDIDAYNNLIASHNDIVSELRTLNQAIDTRLTPQAQ